jgi:hypothetical protein
VTPPGPAAGTYSLGIWLFLRLLALVYFAAFASLAVQVRGLIGREGILPAAPWLEAAREIGPRRFFLAPTVFWLGASDAALLAVTWGGAALSLALFAGVCPVAVLALLWALYLSLFVVGRDFLGFQWDLLLVEAGFVSIFAAPRNWFAPLPAAPPSPVAVALLWWLLFRLLFASGVVKLRSGDPTWRRLDALRFHYETQPLPTRLAWWAHHAPPWFQRLSTAAMFGVELGAPLLIWAPAPFRYAAGLLFIALMALIQATGNYGFFNVLTIALCVPLFDDVALSRVLPFAPPDARPPLWDPFVLPVAALLLLLSARDVARLLGRRVPRPLDRVLRLVEPLRLVNTYGLFAVMTTERPEIVVEGSDDGIEWRAYETRWKPGDPSRAPRFNAPHQPRLDWQLWFAALGTIYDSPWFVRFAERLLAGSPPVRRLLAGDPFPDAPPRYVRAVLYDYRFTDRQTRRETGAWWRRERVGLFCPPISLP